MKRFVVALLLLLLFSTVVTKFVFFDIATIGGNDMAPTLLAGDWLVAYKLNREPKRGDLVMMLHPQRNLVMVRRVVGLPGERVAVRAETPQIGGKPAVRKVLGERTLTGNGSKTKMRLVEERIGKARYVLLKDVERRSVDAPVVTLDNAYYVMSDNRNHGTDSRTFGVVPRDNIRGVIVYRLKAGVQRVSGSAARGGCTSL